LNAKGSAESVYRLQADAPNLPRLHIRERGLAHARSISELELRPAAGVTEFSDAKAGWTHGRYYTAGGY
jgi:hypothetical protein